jgi:putative hydrolase of the HAD superfamily
MDLQIITFDADDTLWVNEPYFQETERHFCQLLEAYLPAHTVGQELYKTELANLELYGFGVKSFILSMLETALRVSEGHISTAALAGVLELGKGMLRQPIELLDGVETVLAALYGRYRLVLATKGDLLDQERKLRRSGLERYFHHIEVMSDKRESDYEKLIRHLDIRPEEFLMVGNSIKSDILPVLRLGGYAVHVPFHTTWVHESTDEVFHLDHERFRQASTLTDILAFLP